MSAHSDSHFQPQTHSNGTQFQRSQGVLRPLLRVMIMVDHVSMLDIR